MAEWILALKMMTADRHQWQAPVPPAAAVAPAAVDLKKAPASLTTQEYAQLRNAAERFTSSPRLEVVVNPGQGSRPMVEQQLAAKF